MVSYPRSLFITAKWLRLDPTSEVAGGRDRYLSPLTCLTVGHLKDMMEREFEHPEIESMEQVGVREVHFQQLYFLS